MFFAVFSFNVWVLLQENLTLLHANNKGANQPACAFAQYDQLPVICSLKSIRLNLLHAEFH